MLEYVLFGGGFAFAAAVQPGPLQAFLLSSVARNGWKRTLPAACAPLISDGPIALLVLLVLNRMPETVGRVLQAAGGVFLLYLAWASYSRWKTQSATREESSEGAPRTLMQAAVINLLNPNPYIGWSLVLGPAIVAAWHTNPTNAIVLLVSFYAVLIAGLGGTILLFGTTSFLGPKQRHTLILVSAILLAVLGVYDLGASVIRVRGG